MYNVNFYQRIFTGIGIVASLLVLGACQRPRNEMIAQYQSQSNVAMNKMMVNIRAARKLGMKNSGQIRGVANSGSAINTMIGYDMPYSSNISGDVSQCVMGVQQYPKEYKYYWAMVSTLLQCLSRQTVAASAPMYGSAFPFMGDQGQAYMRYVVDPRNQSANFNMLPYGSGYQWGSTSHSMGTQANDPLRMWQVLGGQGNGFYQGSF